MNKQKITTLVTRQHALHGFAWVCAKGHIMKRSKFAMGDLVQQKDPRSWPFIKSSEQVTGIKCDHERGVMLIGFNGLKPQFDENLFEPAQATVFELKGRKRAR